MEIQALDDLGLDEIDAARRHRQRGGNLFGAQAANQEPPRALRDTPETFVRVRVTQDAAPATWIPVDAYFRRAAKGWTLVGLERRRG